jgi:hypothetical protein
LPDGLVAQRGGPGAVKVKVDGAVIVAADIVTGHVLARLLTLVVTGVWGQGHGALRRRGHEIALVI